MNTTEQSLLERLYKFLARARFTHASDEVRAADFGEEIKAAHQRQRAIQIASQLAQHSDGTVRNSAAAILNLMQGAGSHKIFDKTYCGEGIIDLPEDIGEAFFDENPIMKNVPKDEHGIHTGRFKVTIEWFEDEDE